ncbi:MAG: hypothetical protein RIS64_2929 [Bacteroidota bacterium]|jgi:hypothetical protein
MIYKIKCKSAAISALEKERFLPADCAHFFAALRSFLGLKPSFCENLRNQSAKSAGKNIL